MSKRLYNISLCFVILFSLVILLPSSFAMTAQVRTDTSSAGLARHEFFTYENNTSGIKIQYPSDWKKHEDKSQVVFTPPLENDPHSSVIIRHFPSQGETLNQIMSDKINNYKKIPFNMHFQLIESNTTTTLANNPASEIVFTYMTQTGAHYKEMDAFIVKGSKAYLVAYIEEQRKYSSYLPAVQKMVNSFEIQGANNINQVYKPVIKLSNRPTGIAVNPNTNMIYVANSQSNIVSVIDGSTYKAITNITVGALPEEVTIDPFYNTAFVASATSNTIDVIDTLTNKLISQISSGNAPVSVAVDPVNYWIFVANKQSNSVTVLAEDGLKTAANIRVNGTPSGIAVNPFTSMAYVAISNSSKVSVIDYITQGLSWSLHTLANINVGTLPPLAGIAINPNKDRIYVVNTDTDAVSVIDGSTYKAITNITVGSGPFDLAINPNNNRVYVTDRNDGLLSVIDGYTNRVISNVTVGHHPAYVAVNPVTNRVYVTDLNDNSMYVINGATNNVTVGVTFKINGTDSGGVNCNGKKLSNNEVTYDLNTAVKCTAQPNSGFAFSSWSGDLATNTPAAVKKISTVFDFIKIYWFGDQAFILDSNSNLTKNLVTKFKVVRYGTLIANFDKTPTPIVLPKEYWDVLYGILTGVILAPLAGWFVPFIIDHNEKKRQLKYLKTYIPLIDKVYKNFRQNKDECLQLLKEKHTDITALLQEGILSYSSYDVLNSRISKYIDEITS